MEEDIQNYSPTVMFRGTPCRLQGYRFESNITILAWRVTYNHDYNPIKETLHARNSVCDLFFIEFYVQFTRVPKT